MSLPDRTHTTPFTYLITPGTLTRANFGSEYESILDTIDHASRAGVSAVQIREKDLSSRLIFELAVSVKAILRGRNTLCLVNERFDIAIAAGADGVHLTSTSMPLSAVRDVVPEEFVIGVSTHTVDEVSEASNGLADLAVFGPVFETPGKPPPAGGNRLADLKRAAEASGGMLLLGIGGINRENYGAVMEAGADGIAAIRLFGDRDAAGSVIDSIRKGDRNAKAKSEK